MNKQKHTDKCGEEILYLLRIQKNFFLTGKTREIHFRRQLLSNLERMLRENETALLEAVCKDLGKAYKETFLTELFPLYQEIRLAKRNLANWSGTKKARTPLFLLPSKSKVHKKPLGVVLIFSTWNYPLQLSLLPLVSSIAAGNCTLLKLAENSKNTTELLLKLIDRYFDREYIAAVTDGFGTLHALKNGRFDLVFYTGGSLVARIVAKAAAEKLTPVILELGGKSPCIVDKSANLKIAAKRIVFGKSLASGQSCVAPDYLFVDSSVKEELIRYIKFYTHNFFTKEPHKNILYPKIINNLHFRRLTSYLDDGDIIFGGEVNTSQRKISLTLIENIKKGSKLLREEIFGPILPVFEYSNINNVISFLQKRDPPLALYLFCRDRNVQKRVINALSFGNGCVNDTMMQMSNPHLPFGGIGLSGNGKYHGKSGFDTFSADSSVLYAPANIDYLRLRYPPFSSDISLLRRISKLL